MKPDAAKLTVARRRRLPKDADTYGPPWRLARNLRLLAASISKLPATVRIKAKLSIKAFNVEKGIVKK